MDHNEFMKLLSMLILLLSLTSIGAQEMNKTPAKQELQKKSPRVVRRVKAYRNAKDECLRKHEDIKGKKLTDCIVEYQKEAK